MAENRNIVIAFDGTSNIPDLNDDGVNSSSNVDKFCKALSKKQSNPTTCIYIQGVGTKYQEGVPGNAFGIGMEERIQETYRDLQQLLTDGKYEKNTLYVIGFSRGAYSARRFAHLLNYSGIPKIIDDWTKGWDNFLNQRNDAAALKQSGDFFDVKIEMLGVWDTVKAAPTVSNIKDEFLPGNVKAAYHAISIDERRKQFDITRFRANQKVREVWFAGVHSDVGGSYPEMGLSDIALNWMIAHAINHGLKFKPSYCNDNINPDPLMDIDPPHDESVNWKFGCITRTIKDDDFIHYTVRDRIAANLATYNKPVNLPETPDYVDEDFV